MAGKYSGIYCANGEIARKYADEGFQMVCRGVSDVSLPNNFADLSYD